MGIFRGFNVFTALVIAASFACLFRIISVVDDVAMITTAHAVTAPQKESATQTELEKSIKDTAKAVEAGHTDENPPPSGQQASQPALSMPPPPQIERAFSDSEIEALQQLAKRRGELDTRETQIAEKEALLRAAEKEVANKVDELNKLKGEIESLLNKQTNMEEERISSLVKIYEGMKPKEAATIFNTLDLDILLPVISRMSERKSSPILASMDPEKARIVTIKLAVERKLPDPAGPSAPATNAADTPPSP